MAYDAELMAWSLKTPTFSMFPGCVECTGLFPFATVVAIAVVFQAARHALGRSARAAFMLASSVGSAAAAIALAVAVSYENVKILAMARCAVYSTSYLGMAFGLQLLCGFGALFAAVENKWMRAEPLATFGLAGNAIGLVVFSPLYMIVAFFVAFLLLAIVSFALSRRRFEGSGSFRCALAMMISLVAPVLYVMATADMPGMDEKVACAGSMSPFADGFFPLRKTLSAIALKTWKANPWIGTGLESFPFDIRFMASDADWSIVSPSQRTALSGWWQLLAERGVIGALMLAVALGMLLWTYVSRLVRSISSVQVHPEHLVGPLVLVVSTALAFFDCSVLRPEVLLIASALLACSGGAFPERVTMTEEGKGN